MKIYWSIYSIPELAGLSKEKRKEVWKECRWNAGRHWQTWLLLLIAGLFAAVGCTLGEAYFGSYGWILAGLFGGLGGGVTGYFVQSICRSDIREYLNSNEKTN